MTGRTDAATARRTRRGSKAFALHLAEMLVAMVAGMVVLGGALEGVLVSAGTSLSDAPTALSAAVMAVNMTVPMVWWMRYRGHPLKHSMEMTGSMVVPTAIIVVLYWLGTIPSGGVMAAQHVVMIPAMVGVMLLRYEHYSRAAA